MILANRCQVTQNIYSPETMRMKNSHGTSIFVLIFSLLAFAGTVYARKYNPAVVLPQLNQQLSKAKTPKDSVKILYDIYDLSSRKDKITVGRMLYDVAGRAKDENAQLDILRLNSNLYSTDDQFERLQKQVKTFPKSEEQRETELFLKMRSLSYSTRRLDSTAHKDIVAIINKLKLTPPGKMNNIDRLLSLYTVAAYMRNVPDSKLLEEYVDSMVHMVNSSNYRLYALRNIVYSEAANIYSDAGETKKAVEANRKLLDIINGLENKYSEAGRKYRDYDISRYIVYRRMLRNYKALTPAEVDGYYDKILKLAQTNEEVAADLKKNNSVQACYFMAKGHYAEALPLLKEITESVRSFPVMKQFHVMLQKAAQETGDSVTLMNSLAAMNALNDEVGKANLSDRYRELQVAYEVNAMQTENYKERVATAEAETKRLRTNFSYNLLIWLLFAALLIVLLFYWSRYRSNIAQIRNIAESLSRQRDQLKADKYNEYDIAPYKEKDSRVNTNDTKLLLKSIITSMLYTAAIGRDERDKNIKEESVSSILRQTGSDIETMSRTNSELDITYPDPDFKMVTDVECVIYLLQRIVLFAQSRRKNDVVTLSAAHFRDSKMMQFVFTHDGERIKMGNEETLFEYIVDIDELHHRNDTSMLLCRLVALLLRCTVVYNPHGDGPAKLIVNVPMRIDA